MALNKVEICGVNTARLPILTNEEKDALFIQIRQGNATMEQLEEYALGLGDVTTNQSGRQEYLENVLNAILFGAN